MGFWLLVAVWVLGWGCIPKLLLLNKRPTATLAWLWAIILFPVIGPALFLMIGTERVKRRRMRRRQAFRGKEHRQTGRAKTAKSSDLLLAEKELGVDGQALLRGLAHITHLPVATVSTIDVLRKAPAFYSALQEDIRQARHSVEIETYIWRNDEVGQQFLALLVETAKRGVAVRVLIDELGSFWIKERFFDPLIAAGGAFSWCHTLSPLRNRYSFNLRNHRKLQVIDGRIGYVGGMNIGREYLGLDPIDGDWSDVQVRVEGTVVEILSQIFAEDWFFATGRDEGQSTPHLQHAHKEAAVVQVLRGGPDEEDQPMLRSVLAIVQGAKKRLWFATGYFVPGEVMQTALQVAAARGVDVRLLISQKSEHPYLVKAGRSYYDALLRQGVKIFEYSRGIEHSKYIVIDEEWITVGSTNLDERSLRLNFELSLLAHCRKTNRVLAQIFEKTVADAHEINRVAFARRPYWEKLAESALRPLSPVL